MLALASTSQRECFAGQASRSFNSKTVVQFSAHGQNLRLPLLMFLCLVFLTMGKHSVLKERPGVREGQSKASEEASACTRWLTIKHELQKKNSTALHNQHKKADNTNSQGSPRPHTASEDANNPRQNA